MGQVERRYRGGRKIHERRRSIFGGSLKKKFSSSMNEGEGTRKE